MRYKNIFSGETVTVTKEGYDPELDCKAVDYTRDNPVIIEEGGMRRTYKSFTKPFYVFERCYVPFKDVGTTTLWSV